MSEERLMPELTDADVIEAMRARLHEEKLERFREDYGRAFATDRNARYLRNLLQAEDRLSTYDKEALLRSAELLEIYSKEQWERINARRNKPA